ncbi:MAG: aminotransferase class IV family protein [Bacteroidales bacterium]|nr:aminotransferase class IV family protein [Bacteroidales bacterium]
MECSQDYYIHNFKFLASSDFNEELFQNGISIYEVIRIEKGIPLFLENHLNRLYHSADISNFNINESYCDFETLIEQLITKNKTYQGKIRIVIHYNSSNNNTEKDTLIYFTPHFFPTTEEYSKGVKTGICKAIRTNPNAKILNSEARSKANNSIVENKLFEVILQNSDGFISEGSRSNIFFIKDQTVITPPEKDVLMGITRTNIIKICKENGINITEKKIHFSEFPEINSAFISGTSLKVLPVKTINNNTFNTKNPVLRKIMKLYDSLIEDYLNSQKEIKT